MMLLTRSSECTVSSWPALPRPATAFGYLRLVPVPGYERQATTGQLLLLPLWCWSCGPRRGANPKAI
jgi:hypothetical protein